MTGRTAKAAVRELRLEAACQVRESLDPDIVEEYRLVYDKTPRQMPLIEVWQLLDENGRAVIHDERNRVYVVVDGFHRVAAMIKADIAWTDVDITGQGQLVDCAWYALTRNATHGKRRTEHDARKAARMALEHPRGAKLSNAALGEHLRVDQRLISEVRAAIEASIRVPDAPPSPPARRTGRDGKSYAVRPREEYQRAGRAAAARKLNAALVAGAKPAPALQPAPEPVVTHAGAVAGNPVLFTASLSDPALRAAEILRTARLQVAAIVRENAYLAEEWTSAEKSVRDAEQAMKMGAVVACPACKGAGCRRCKEGRVLARAAASIGGAT